MADTRVCRGVAMPSRRPAGRCCPVGSFYRSGVSVRETGLASGAELQQSSRQRRSFRSRKSSELRSQREFSDPAKSGQYQQIGFSSGFSGGNKSCQGAKEVKGATLEDLTKLELYERRMVEEEALYATVRRVKGEGEGFRPYQAPRQPYEYQVRKEKRIQRFIICFFLTGFVVGLEAVLLDQSSHMLDGPRLTGTR